MSVDPMFTFSTDTDTMKRQSVKARL